MLGITTNVASLNAQRNLLKTTNNLNRTFTRLSSGLRINGAKDDAAGLSISTRMTAQIRALNQSVRNANDGVSMVQVAEGALDETTSALQRIRELSVQAANDTLVSSDRGDIWDEIVVLMSEINRISDDTEFNGQNLLGESGGTFAAKFHVGNEANQTIDIAVNNAGISAVGLGDMTYTAESVATELTGTEAQSLAENLISSIDTALDSVSDIRSNLGAVQNRLESIIANLDNRSESTSAARSRIMDADIAAETATLTKNSILQQAGTAILSQANAQPQLALQLLG
ncbi:MAG: flagellin FliC [Magnetococcales bacterium]|nr:flagellin FliC [Magnetococcales bacterium]